MGKPGIRRTESGRGCNSGGHLRLLQASRIFYLSVGIVIWDQYDNIIIALDEIEILFYSSELKLPKVC